jgi:mRNA interferase RelE/StbE
VTSRWQIVVTPAAVADLNRLDKSVRERIKKFIFERLPGYEDPRSIGEALKGTQLGDLWRYRVGDYRVMARIEDALIMVMVIKIGHRSKVYDK